FIHHLQRWHHRIADRIRQNLTGFPVAQMNPQTLPPTMHVLERGWLSSNNILFTGRSGAALVDSGYATQAPQTVALVASLLKGRPLDLLINTHLHSDHCGGNAALRQTWGCRTLIPA